MRIRSDIPRLDLTQLFSGSPTTRAGLAPDPTSRPPVVIWSVTRTCNLECARCATDSRAQWYGGELSTADGRALLDELAGFGVSTVVFAGGEPLARPDALSLAEHAMVAGLGSILWTNGTLLDAATAARLRQIGFTEVTVFVEGVGDDHDPGRGLPPAFARAVQAVRHCRAVGQPVCLHVTLTPATVDALDAIFDLIALEGIERACFAHPVPGGRGSVPRLPADRTREAVATIVRHARALLDADADDACEISTVGNDADGPYVFLSLLARGREAEAQRVLAQLVQGGGARFGSGVGVCHIDAHGDVHPDQFWRSATFGNVTERPFRSIWTDPTNALHIALRDRVPLLKGRCASCRFVQVCGGNVRARSLAATGDIWAPDPACYLTDDEIAVTARPLTV